MMGSTLHYKFLVNEKDSTYPGQADRIRIRSRTLFTIAKDEMLRGCLKSIRQHAGTRLIPLNPP